MLRRIVTTLVLGPIVRTVMRVVRDAEDRAAETGKEEASDSEGIEPFASFEGRITLNQLSAPAMSGEFELGAYDKEAGRYELKEPSGGKPHGTTRLTTFIDDEEGGQQMTVRWERGRGKIRLEKARRDEVWRIEFYKVADAKETASPTMPGASPDGFSPFGGNAGGVS